MAAPVIRHGQQPLLQGVKSGVPMHRSNRRVYFAMDHTFYNLDLRILDGGSVSLYNRWNYPNLSAPYWRFYWNSTPDACVHLDGQRYPLLPDQFMLIPPDTPFASSCTGEPRHFCLHFLAAHPYAGVAPAIFTFPLTSEMRRLVETAIAMETRDRRAYSLQLLRIVLTALLTLPDEVLRRPLLDPRVAVAMHRLERDGVPPDNRELARQARLSVNAFLRLFRRHAGKSPQQYGRQCRIDQACLLLHYSGRDIKAIAETTGFCDRYHFSRIFKQLRGVSPAEFRRCGQAAVSVH